MMLLLAMRMLLLAMMMLLLAMMMMLLAMMVIQLLIKQVIGSVYSGPKWEIFAVIKAMIAVGPMLMSFSLKRHIIIKEL